MPGRPGRQLALLEQHQLVPSLERQMIEQPDPPSRHRRRSRLARALSCAPRSLNFTTHRTTLLGVATGRPGLGQFATINAANKLHYSQIFHVFFHNVHLPYANKFPVVRRTPRHSGYRHHRRRHRWHQCGVPSGQARRDECGAARAAAADLRHHMACGGPRGPIAGDPEFDPSGQIYRGALLGTRTRDRPGDRFQTARLARGRRQ